MDPVVKTGLLERMELQVKRVNLVALGRAAGLKPVLRDPPVWTE